jgi:ATP-dependent Clp protease ATP-binding subunit ClpA
MFERFTVTARLAVVGAQEQACRRGDDRIRTEHLLLALYDVPDHLADTVLDVLGADRAAVERAVDERRAGGRVSDAAALATLGIDLDEVRRQVEEAFGPGALERTRAAGAGRRRLGGRIPFDRATKKALELALREAVRFEHRHLGPEHLLLGLLQAEGAAGEILAERGIQLDATRTAVQEMGRHRRAG